MYTFGAIFNWLSRRFQLQFKMADFDGEVDGARELLQDLCIAQDTSKSRESSHPGKH